jgi:hypothetical protein
MTSGCWIGAMTLGLLGLFQGIGAMTLGLLGLSRRIGAMTLGLMLRVVEGY